jgi:hypothetical protein
VKSDKKWFTRNVFSPINQNLNHFQMRLDGNHDFHQISIWARPCILMFLLLVLENGNCLYVNPLADCVKKTKITR